MNKKVNQKLISFKIDDEKLLDLDFLCEEYGIKRNRMLNILIAIGINNLGGNLARFNMIDVYSHVLPDGDLKF